MHEVGSTIKEIAGGEPVLSIQPGGNFGDQLIYLGYDVIQRAADINTVEFNEKNRSDCPIELPTANIISVAEYVLYQIRYLQHRVTTSPSAVYIHGGGNFNDIWGLGIRCYRMAARFFDCPIVVGPQSCRFESTNPSRLFRTVTNRTHFFCREEYSYRLMKEATDALDDVTIHLADDTALVLTKADLPEFSASPEYTLIAIRSDAESANPILQEDIAAPIRVSDPSVSADTFEEFVNTVAKARHIHTDRLHVAILGSILNKSVTWYDVDYHKSRGVYEYSLRGTDRITFVPQESFPDSG